MTGVIQTVSLEVQAVNAQEFIGGYVEIFHNPNYTSLKTWCKHVGLKETKQIGFVVMASLVKDRIEIEPIVLREAIDNIVENYNDVSLEDITYFSKRLIRGEFIGKKIGTSKDDLVTIKVFKYDVPLVCLMFQRYYAERLSTIEDLRSNEAKEHTRTDENGTLIHPDILNMFTKEDKTIFVSLKQFCELQGVKENCFTDQYTKQYNELDNRKDGKEIMTVDEYVNHKINSFLVLQNNINSGAGINQMFMFEKMINHCKDYDTQSLIDMCKDIGLYNIPTDFYYCAKKLLFEGGVIKFRYDISEGNVTALTSFIKKLLEDSAVSTTNTLFIISMIFNFSLNRQRFWKYNQK